MDSDNLSNDLNQDSSLTKIFSSDEKIEFYNRALEEIKERVNEIDSLVSKMATVASVLRTHLPYYFWCGFYFAEEDEMVIGNARRREGTYKVTKSL